MVSCANKDISYEVLVCTKFKISSNKNADNRIFFYHFPEAISKANLMAQGTLKSKGEIICFLDDDDIFKPFKIERIAEVFQSTQGLGYIRNSVELIDTNGQVIKRNWENIRDFSYEKDKGYLSELIRHFPDFNASSISIKRDLIMRYEPLLEELNSSDDTFLFYCALSSNSKILCLGERLSEYRMHSKGITHFTGNFNKFRLNLKTKIEGDLKSHRIFAKVFKDKGFNELLSVRIKYYSIILRIACGETNRRDTLAESFFVIKHYDLLNMLPRRFFVVTEALVSLFSVNLAYIVMFLLSRF